MPISTFRVINLILFLVLILSSCEQEPLRVEDENLSLSSDTITFDVVGNDRPGIIQELASAIVRAGGNVEELASNLESAPHAGHPVFRASGSVAVTADFDENELITALEALGPDLAVSLDT